MPSPSPPSTASPVVKTSEADGKDLSSLVEGDSTEHESLSGIPTPAVSFAASGTGPEMGASSQSQPTSIRFAAAGKVSPNTASPAVSISPAAKKGVRMASPPPPSPYKPRITFDLFANQSATDPSLTLISQHRQYARQKGSRTYLCGTDESDYAAFALEYLIDKLVDDGDDIVCVRVVDRGSDIASDFSIKEAEYKSKARQVQGQVQEMLDGENRPAVKVVIEFAVGKIGETIDRMVNLHTPISVVVGTRGKSLAGTGFGKGSVSQYLYHHSPVPVVIVRPHEVRLKHLRKRQNDPNRQDYINHADTAKDSERARINSIAGSVVQEASQNEREAVAKAIGLPQDYDKWALRQSSGSRNNSKDRRASTDSRTGISESSEEEDGASLSRVSSTKSHLNVEDDEVYAVEGSSFEDMPNFVPGLGDQSDAEDVYEIGEGMDISSENDGMGSANAPAQGKEKA